MRLWELEAATALTQGPGVMALVPLMKGHNLPLIEQAARRIRREAPVAEQPDLLAILRALAGRRYTASRLARLVAREVLMQSDFWREAIAEGKALGRAEERLRVSRELCAAVARRHHPAQVKRLLPAIESCTDVRLLQSWILQPGRMAEGVAAVRGVRRASRAHRRAATTPTPRTRRSRRH